MHAVTEALDFAVPLWAWFALGVGIVVMLAIDLFRARRHHRHALPEHLPHEAAHQVISR